jgi:hypothetical protein
LNKSFLKVISKSFISGSIFAVIISVSFKSNFVIMKLLLSVVFFLLAFSSSQVFAQDKQKVEIIIECENDGDFVNYYLLVRNFVELEAVQGTLAWNADSLGFVEFENQGIPSFSPTNNLNLNETDAGILRFVWFNPGSVGATINDDGVMFKLRFEIKEGIGKLKLIGDPVQILFLDKEFEEVDLEVSYGNTCVISSIHQQGEIKDEFFLYPNPVQRGQKVIIETNNIENEFRQLRVFSADGKAYSFPIDSSIGGLQLPQELVPGNYFFSLVDKKDRVITTKVLVQ